MKVLVRCQCPDCRVKFRKLIREDVLSTIPRTIDGRAKVFYGIDAANRYRMSHFKEVKV